MSADWYPGIQAFCSHWRHAPMLQRINPGARPAYIARPSFTTPGRRDDQVDRAVVGSSQGRHATVGIRRESRTLLPVGIDPQSHQNAGVAEVDAGEHDDLQIERVERSAEPLAKLLLRPRDEPTGDGAL